MGLNIVTSVSLVKVSKALKMNEYKWDALRECSKHSIDPRVWTTAIGKYVIQYMCFSFLLVWWVKAVKAPLYEIISEVVSATLTKVIAMLELN